MGSNAAGQGDNTGAMNLSSLEILIAAIEEKSLSRAAERMHLVTSAASKRISDLERRLGTTLLRRHGRGVEPSPAGAMLYQQAKAILRNVAQARESMAAYSNGGVPNIRLVANSSTVLQFLPADISAFARKMPASRVDLVEASATMCRAWWPTARPTLASTMPSIPRRALFQCLTAPTGKAWWCR